MLGSLVDRARAERGVTRVRVSLEGQLAEVEDDGEGLPVEIDPRSGRRVAERLMTSLCRPESCELAIANALSSRLEIESRRDGYAWHQTYARGNAVGEMERGARTTRTGTRIRLHADPAIFAGEFDRPRMRERLWELAAHDPELRFELMAETIMEPRGLAGWLARRHGGETLSEIFCAYGRRGEVEVDVAIAWSDDGGEDVTSTVDRSTTPAGGTHERGVWRGVVAAIVRRTSSTGAPRRARERLQGLRAIVAVKMPWPAYSGCLRDRLASPEADAAVCALVAEEYGAFLDARPGLARRLVKALG